MGSRYGADCLLPVLLGGKDSAFRNRIVYRSQNHVVLAAHRLAELIQCSLNQLHFIGADAAGDIHQAIQRNWQPVGIAALHGQLLTVQSRRIGSVFLLVDQKHRQLSLFRPDPMDHLFFLGSHCRHRQCQEHTQKYTDCQ